MKPIKFPEHNVVFWENQQPLYEPLPAYRSPDGQVICCFELTDEEKQRVAETGHIWLSVLTFNYSLQPVYLTTEKGDIFKNPK